MDSDASILIGIYVSLGVAGAAIILLLIARFRLRNRVQRVTYQTIIAANWAIFGMMLVIIFSLGAGLSGDAGTVFKVFYGIIAFLFLLFFVISIIIAKKDIVSKFFKNYWNMHKAFGGGLFGDFANTLGIMAGVGAFQLSHADPSWFWLGQIGGMLAILVGLSLCLRVYLDTLAADPDRSVKFKAFYAVANVAVGCFTIVSLLGPVTGTLENPTPVTTLEIQKTTGAIWSGVMGLFIVISFILLNWELSATETWYPNQLPSRNRRLIGIIYLFPLLLTFGSFIPLLIWQFNSNPPDWLPTVFASLATWSWIAIEAAGLVEIKGDASLSTPVRIFRNQRGVAIIYGNLVMFSLLISIAVASQPVDGYKPIHWILYTQAFSFLTLATVTGIILAANATAKKRAEAQREQRRQDVRLPGPPNSNPFRANPRRTEDVQQEAIELEVIKTD